MSRTLLFCVLALGPMTACDTKAADEARAAAEAKLAARDKEIADLKAQLAAKPAPAPAAPAPITPPPAPAGPGRLDAEFVRAVAASAGAREVSLEVEGDGAVRKLALYHDDVATLPAPVLALLEQQYPGGKAVKYETEVYAEHGRVFEVEVKTKDRRECEYSARPDGTLFYNECEIDAKTLPEPIRSAIPKAVPGAKIDEAEKTTYADGRAEYTVEVTAGGKEHELYFDADGALLRHELVIAAEFEVTVPG
jgi:uncharacterized membrane protein YkoI